MEGVARFVDVDDTIAYLALGDAGIAAVDVSDPSAPTVASITPISGSAQSLAVSPEHDVLYVTAWNDTRVYDVSDPTAPVLIAHEVPPQSASLLTGGNAIESRSMGIVADGEHVFACNWDLLSRYQFHAGVQAPDLAATPFWLDMPKTAVNDTSAALVLLRNDGLLPIETIETIPSAGLEVALLPERVEPGASELLEVRYTATNDEPFEGQIVVRSDDIDQPEQTIVVRANPDLLSVGDHIPDDWTLTTLTDESYPLAPLADQVVLLAYFATF